MTNRPHRRAQRFAAVVLISILRACSQSISAHGPWPELDDVQSGKPEDKEREQ